MVQGTILNVGLDIKMANPHHIFFGNLLRTSIQKVNQKFGVVK
jgi:hypothetical protein